MLVVRRVCTPFSGVGTLTRPLTKFFCHCRDNKVHQVKHRRLEYLVAPDGVFFQAFPSLFYIFDPIDRVPAQWPVDTSLKLCEAKIQSIVAFKL